jgi:hypothetical protein
MDKDSFSCFVQFEIFNEKFVTVLCGGMMIAHFRMNVEFREQLIFEN